MASQNFKYITRNIKEDVEVIGKLFVFVVVSGKMTL